MTELASHGHTKSPGRLHIAVLLDHLNFYGRGYEGQLRDVLCSRARQAGHSLLLLYGGALDAPGALGADNALFHLIRPGDFDGIIIASSLISAYCGGEGVAKLALRYQPAKLCSIGIALPGVPSLVLDNRAAMSAAVEHLIRDHGRRQPVFLAGTPKNPEAESRFEAYLGALEKFDIPFDPARVASGHFLPALGRAAMDEILDRGVPFDAVVAANDSMAIGAIQALRKRELRIPEDVAVTGFDDLTLARLGNPPLTTIAQPFDVFAERALACIEAQVAGHAVPEVVEIPSHFVRRQSCGCYYRTATHSRTSAAIEIETGDALLADRLEALMPILAEVLKRGDDDGRTAAERLGQGLVADLGGHKGAFQKAVSALLVDIADDDEGHRGLQSAINRLRNGLLDMDDLAIERALHDGFSMVALSNTAAQVRHRLELDESYVRLLSVGEQASTAFDVASLRDSLMRDLPAAGVRTAILSCRADKRGQQLEPVVCYVDGAVWDTQPTAFPARRLLPPEILRAPRVSTLLVFPMVDDSGLLGVVAFDHQDGNNAYIAFRNQIAAVLKSIRLHEEVLHKRLEAMTVLAGGVAHDLNNALGPLLVLPDIILEQLAQAPVDPAALSDVRSDVASIKTACQRAAQTIKDLLTLGRQGRAPQTYVDLNDLVRSCMADGRLAAGASDAPNVRVTWELANRTLGLHGAESQLARAVSNLVRNAIEASADAGEVSVRTARDLVVKSTSGFENIPPGDYATLTVSDNGCGIAPEDLRRVFEPFFSKKSANDRSGTGLGLAIVHSVVKEHRGYIDVASTPERGTTFTLYFPAVSTPKQQPTPRSAPARGSAKILVIDDDESQLRTSRRVLTCLGYEVEVRSKGEEAVAMFQAGQPSPFDLLLVDMLLGGSLDGLQVVEHIRDICPGQKAIIVSGHAPSERAEAAVRQGLSWLAKPYGLDALAGLVANVLREGGRR
jgi:signal transduction histidine kinase/DNA-binding LacI/PurR family transcriptional regulator/ActR/RegA family two-component response regulator